jgi:hypothetical protein
MVSFFKQTILFKLKVPKLLIFSTAVFFLFLTFNCNAKVAPLQYAVSVFAGTGIAGYSGDGGKATNAKLNGPYGVMIDSSNSLFFADTSSFCVRKVNSTNIITTFAGMCGIRGSSGSGAATNAQFDTPRDITTDSNGDFYIVDGVNNDIRKVAAATNIISIFTTASNKLIKYIKH